MRKKIDSRTETKVLTRSLRRCALCYALNNDVEIKKGQIAHIDKDPQNNNDENLIFLCLDHHAEYDSRTSQSKNFTKSEILEYRVRLDNAVDSNFTMGNFPDQKQESNIIDIGQYYLISDGESRANIFIFRSTPDFDGCKQVHLYGESCFGISRVSGPNIGVINEVLRVHRGDCLSYFDGEYSVIVFESNGGILIEETNPHLRHGMGVTFSGQYGKVKPWKYRIWNAGWFHMRKIFNRLPS